MVNKQLPYTSSWFHTLGIGTLIGTFLAFILIYLQPLDTYSYVDDYKNLKLAGYGLIILVFTLLMHLLEEYFYQKQHQRWYFLNEIIALVCGMFFIILACYLYNTCVVNELKPSVQDWLGYMWYIAPPYLPLILPFWIFLRLQFGHKFSQQEQKQEQQISPILVAGKNKSDLIKLVPTAFLYAQAQQNYAEIYFFNTNQQVEKKMLRTTLADLNAQLPHAQQIHRSYIVNPDYVRAIQGNSRKRNIVLKNVSIQLPLSSKFYPKIQNKLSNSSPRVQSKP